MKSKVYFIDFKTSFTRNIFDKLSDIADKSGFYKFFCEYDKIAIKLHFGEYGNFGVVNPRFIRFFVDRIKEKGGNPFITDTNTLYAGHRCNSIDHLNLALLHGYNPEVVNAPLIIADGILGQNDVSVLINKELTKTAYIASDIYHCEAILAISHLTGHIATGFGAAIKNIGMGCASSKGKIGMHSKSKPKVNKKLCTGCERCIKWCLAKAISIIDGKAIIDKNKCTGCTQCISVCPSKAITINWDAETESLTKKIAEYAYAVISNKSGKMFFVNFLNNITALCDCVQIHGERLIPDIGILFSDDIVAIDKASIELVNEKAGEDLFKSLYPKIDWRRQLQYAEQLGLGIEDYELIKINGV
ncbi:MAG: DUF362 domain-containing protein [Candidatus Cloacimonetes bacterium]|nr:DUF362 domain-containing protein [Candidatus Cloacimonadota bacterium]MBL7086338.1 DUF362 domain-containing protein [Candidatus Cloacimonadota bacterium]